MTRAQLQLMISDARKRFVDMPAETRLEGESSSLSESERVALCYLIASLGVFQRHGLEEPALDYADSDPATE